MQLQQANKGKQAAQPLSVSLKHITDDPALYELSVSLPGLRVNLPGLRFGGFLATSFTLLSKEKKKTTDISCVVRNSTYGGRGRNSTEKPSLVPRQSPRAHALRDGFRRQQHHGPDQAPGRQEAAHQAAQRRRRVGAVHGHVQRATSDIPASRGGGAGAGRAHPGGRACRQGPRGQGAGPGPAGTRTHPSARAARTDPW